nr:hypothetical protein CFP56_10275 [Quercus suber]
MESTSFTGLATVAILGFITCGSCHRTLWHNTRCKAREFAPAVILPDSIRSADYTVFRQTRSLDGVIGHAQSRRRRKAMV